MTTRDDDILETLAWRVRLILAVQAAQIWWSSNAQGLKYAVRRLRQLATAGWLSEYDVLAQPLLELSAPVVRWCPGNPPPPFLAVSRRLRKRWRLPARQVQAFVANKPTRRAFGLPDRRPIRAHHQVTHDLHVTQVYAWLRRSSPELATQWVGEDALTPAGPFHVVPDAMLVNVKTRAFRAIEFGGRYSADRIARFHDDCVGRHLPYEIW